MNKQHILLFITLSFLTFLSCESSTDKLIKTHMKQADECYQHKNFIKAKGLLDTVIDLTDPESETAIKARKLLRSISIDEQNQNLKYLDSMLIEREKAIVPLKRNFLEVKEEGLPLMLVHTKQLAAHNYLRSYIKPALESAGNYYITSYLCCGSHINHTRIKASAGDQSIESEEVPFDDFDNRHLDDGQYKWEIVKFKDGKDNGVIDFIAQNADKPIKIQYIGKGSTAIFLEQYDKEAIRDSYEISLILKEIAQIKTNRENAQKELKRLGQ